MLDCIIDGLKLADVGCLQFAVVALSHLELNRSALVQSLVAIHLDFGPVHEQVFPALLRDEAVTLVRIEPLNSTLRHFVSFFPSPPNRLGRGPTEHRGVRCSPSLREHEVHYTPLNTKNLQYLEFRQCFVAIYTFAAQDYFFEI